MYRYLLKHEPKEAITRAREFCEWTAYMWKTYTWEAMEAAMEKITAAEPK